MQQSQRLLTELKRALKQRQVGYEQVGIHLGLSTSSVKRLFSRGGMSLERLEAICELVDMDLVELARLAEDGRRQLEALSIDQEREVIADPMLLLVAICALNRWRFEEMQETYNFTTAELVGYLVRLDRLGLVELLPNNRIRLRIARNFAWLPNGPIHKFFVRNVQDEFLAGEFEPGQDVYKFSWGMLSERSCDQLRPKIQELLELFDSLASADEVRSGSAISGRSLLVAFRDWEPEAFRAQRR